MPENQPISLNLNVRGLRPSATLAINEKSNALLQQGKQVYKLGLGQSPFPVPERVVESLQEHAHQKDYLPVKGLLGLRQAIAKFNEREHGIVSKADDILIGPGSKELIFILQLVYYGEILIPTPGWVSYSPQARIVGRQVQFLPTKARNKWRLTAKELDTLCRADPTRPRVIILNYPSNPTGCTYSDKELQALARVARKYKVVVVSDEIYSLLHFKGEQRSIAEFYPEGTIISSGLSKWCGAGGWRLGTFSFPDGLHWLRDAMAIVASETFTATSAPIQHAAITAFSGGPDIDRYLGHSRKILAYLGHWMSQRLQAMGAKVIEPEGAFYIFPDFENHREKLEAKDIYASTELADRILEETGVAMLPGYDFGRQAGELTMRLAYVDFEGRDALNEVADHYEGKELDEAFLNKCCPRLVEAMDRLASWFAGL